MLQNKIEIISRNRIEDHRGWFLKVITGTENHLSPTLGEFYVTVAQSNQSKGGHYHPIAKEWFTLLKGSCVLESIDIETKEYISLELNENQPQTIFVPNNIAHNFKNNSASEFILLAYSDILYNPTDTLVYPF